MALEDRIARSRLIPPRPRPTWVRRPRIEARLREALQAPVTVVRADPGYGKTTAVAQMVHYGSWPAAWYSLAETDQDPLLFLAHLIAAAQTLDPGCGARALTLLQSPGGGAQHGPAVIDTLANELLDRLSREALLILDDYHLVEGPEINPLVERLIEQMPPTLHLILLTRQTPAFRNLVRWRAYGEVQEITTADLAFTPEEVQALFTAHGVPLPPEAIHRLAEETEGWIIALLMILHRLRESGREPLEILLERIPDTLPDLFDYFAGEVLSRQPPEIQRFLLQTSILAELDPEACAAVLENPEDRALLPLIEGRGLFLSVSGGGRYRYHHLFQEFLQRQARVRLGNLQPLHRRAAAFYHQRRQWESAIAHLIAAEAFEEAAGLLATVAGGMIQQGRYSTLAAWIDRLPPAVVETDGELLRHRGDAARLLSRFEEALAWYERARQVAARQGDSMGEADAWTGQALVFLDTVQPNRAAPLLREALRRVRRGAPEARLRLLGLMAENLLNAGRLSRADLLLALLQRRDPAVLPPDVEARLRIRQGRLAQARLQVESLMRAAPWGTDRQRIPRSHREATVLMAWIGAMTGEGEMARRYAEQGLRIGRDLRSPIIECVALARLGHGWLSGPDYDLRRAEEAYQESLRAAEAIRVPRFEVEAHMGLTVVEGLKGRPGLAIAHGRRGLEILEEAGDAYLATAVWLALGIAGLWNGDPRAIEWLEAAIRAGSRCGERYFSTLARLWQAWALLRQGERSASLLPLKAALETIQAEGYAFMLTGTPMLGLRDPGARLLLLQTALGARLASDYLGTLWSQALQASTSHAPFGPWALPPGENRPHPPLYIQTLGPFRVWRGLYEIPAEAWGRTRARRLFQFLIVHRRRPVHREEILEALWPDRDPASAALELRVTLHALHRALEPTRRPGQPPFYVIREGEFLRLNPHAILHIDADLFVSLLARAQEREPFAPDEALSGQRQALALMQGEFLEECRYEDWVIPEREYLSALYLSAAEQVAKALAARNAWEEVIPIAQRILERDPYHEAACGLLVQGYWALGQRALAVRTYERFRQRMRKELGVEPTFSLAALREGPPPSLHER
ncbi:Serine/threonine-protein kinase PknK [Candidatus Thermoflexus japonica]|uniref:Serine/threonine-protein kinase PknK n=1 Tax=Candidatus Thermoflexus japonica TaxID=2035417 RepID=A0A2H5Y555_9CHLR|nr:Serine/threonine-protein kinase PknK [Candidatus Thermoflexus japonica]